MGRLDAIAGAGAARGHDGLERTGARRRLWVGRNEGFARLILNRFDFIGSAPMFLC